MTKDRVHRQPGRDHWKGERKTGESEGEREKVGVEGMKRRQRRAIERICDVVFER